MYALKHCVVLVFETAPSAGFEASNDKWLLITGSLLQTLELQPNGLEFKCCSRGYLCCFQSICSYG